MPAAVADEAALLTSSSRKRPAQDALGIGRKKRISVSGQALPVSVAGQFTLFSQLPPEIRHQIWQATLPEGRVFLVEERFDQAPYQWIAHSGTAFAELVHQTSRLCDGHVSSPPIAAPVIAAVCHESRAVAMRGGAGWRHMRSRDHWSHPRGRLTWFNPRVDVLCVQSWFYMRPPTCTDEEGGDPLGDESNSPYEMNPQCFDLRDLCRDLQTICVGLRSLTWEPLAIPNVFAFNLVNRELWPRLQRYLFYSDIIRVHPPSICSPAITIPCFPDGTTTLLVDPRDKTRLRTVLDLCQPYCTRRHRPAMPAMPASSFPPTTMGSDAWYHQQRSRHGRFEVDLSTLVAWLRDPQRCEDYISQQIDALRDVWLHAHYSALPDKSPLIHDMSLFRTSNLDPPPNPRAPRFQHSHPWAARKLTAMPKYDLVIVFQLCTSNTHEIMNFTPDFECGASDQPMGSM